MLGKDSKIFNHHFGIGSFKINMEHLDQQEITREINRLEINQINTICKFLSNVNENTTILDAGCGRGGTSLFIKQKFNPAIKGINISDYQVAFANNIVKELKLENINFEVMNYLNLTFDANTFDYIILNEVTQYALNLEILFSELFKVLKKDGHLIIATWCMEKNYSNQNWAIKINEHYGLRMHPIDAYLSSLQKVGFTVEQNHNYSKQAVPYFELRELWDMKSGVEPYFIEGFRDRKLLYKFIKCKK